ncbi:Serine/threonine protein kinase [Globisporangium polare]
MASTNVDDLLVPSMMDTNVGGALLKLSSLTNELKESEALGKHLQDRLLFLHGRPELVNLYAPVLYADAVGTAVRFAKKYSAKSPLHRIAANRSMLRDLRDIHNKIDALFMDLQLEAEPAMSAWQDIWETDLAAQANRFANTLASMQPVSELDSNSVEEAITLLKYEAEKQEEGNTEAHLSLIKAALELPRLPDVPKLPEFFIPRDDIETLGETFEHGFIGEVHKAKLGVSKQVVAVKHFFLDTKTVQKDFIARVTIACRIDHPHVLKLHGGCHVGQPVFTVCEFASHGNFLTYFENSAHKSNFWKRVREAVEGLSHLHEQGILHGDVRCKNILVGSDGKTRISDAGYNNIRRMSVGRSLNSPPNSIRWSAPECLLEQGHKAEPTNASDIYSFGMTIIEAKTGARPWPNVERDDDIIDVHCDDEIVYERPQEFTEQEWEIVQGICKAKAGDRMSLDEVIAKIDELPKPCCEKARLKTLEAGGELPKFCGECGQPFETPAAP